MTLGLGRTERWREFIGAAPERDVRSCSMVNDADPLKIDYLDHEHVVELIDVVTFCFEGISLAFDRWDDEYARGPGLYLVVVSGHSVASFADPMGKNRWPIDRCPLVSADCDHFFGAACEVAIERDGALVVSVDGTILEQMVRFKDLTDEELARIDAVETVEYADWMGARHMSAADTSAREDVVAALTLSEEDGRVAIFNNGTFEAYHRHELGGRWRKNTERTTPIG